MKAPGARQDHFPLFDGFRGMAILVVIFVHGWYQIAINTSDGEWLYRWAVHLDIGAPIFFGVSGFLLWRPFVAARVREKPFRLKAYAWRRFLRIVPAYWIALFVIGVLYLSRPELESVKGVIRFFGFAQVYDGRTAILGLGQAWTLNIEVTFYALLPVLFYGLNRLAAGKPRMLRYDLGLVAIAWGGSWLYKLAVAPFFDPAARSDLPFQLITPAWFDTLSIGMLLAVISVHSEKRKDGSPGETAGLVARLDRIPAGAYWVAAGVAFLASCLFGFDGSRENPTTDAQFLLDHFFDGVCVLLLLAPGVFGDQSRGLVRRFVSQRWLLWIGMISYSLYLYHYVAVAELIKAFDGVPESTGGWLVWIAGMYAGGIALGAAGYYLVERPFMNLKRLVPAHVPASEQRYPVNV